GVHVSVLDERNQLALSGNPRSEKRIQVINRCEVRRNDRIGVPEETGNGKFGARSAQFVHRTRAEIVQRNHAGNNRSKVRGNARLADVRDVQLILGCQVVYFRLESAANLPGRAGKVDQHSARINDIYLEALRAQPTGHRIEIGWGNAVTRAKFLSGQPAVKIGRPFAVQLFNVVLKRSFTFRRTL